MIFEDDEQFSNQRMLALEGAMDLICLFFFFFLRFCFFTFIERRREGERQGEKHQCAVAYWGPGLQLRHVP